MFTCKLSLAIVFVVHSNTRTDLTRSRQEALSKFQSWMNHNKFTLSTEKSIYILFSKTLGSPRTTWNNKPIKRAKSLKYVVVHLDDKLNWSDDIKIQTDKAHKLLLNLCAYRITPTATLQVMLGILPLHLQLQYEAHLTTLFGLQIPLSPNLTTIQPQDLEKKTADWSTYLSKFLNQDQTSLDEIEVPETPFQQKHLKIYTDGSITEFGM
ncbi:hypothetical protein AVEN_44028-1 [Araneus ventricosus]|uniref:Reverse transcriptase domain-containing protein n=1 Tax=Araneus ventricosus TaxID=182803 RepID=A0A4Y2GJ98_ARAVE|nr:hypothetical protein AVEN_44028-1 [Araneus ventricosus]